MTDRKITVELTEKQADLLSGEISDWANKRLLAKITGNSQ